MVQFLAGEARYWQTVFPGCPSQLGPARPATLPAKPVLLRFPSESGSDKDPNESCECVEVAAVLLGARPSPVGQIKNRDSA